MRLGAVLTLCASLSCSSLAGDPEREAALSVTGIGIVGGMEDSETWTWVIDFVESPNSENSEHVFAVLERKLTHWESHTSELVKTIISAIGNNRVPEGAVYLEKFLLEPRNADGAETIARSAAISLGKIGGDRALELLTEALSTTPESIHSSIAVALGLLDDVRSVPPLESVVETGAPQSRRRAFSALARYCSRSSRPLVLAHLEDSDELSRRGATRWLASCGNEDDVPRLSDRLLDPNDHVKANALKGLLRLGTDRGCPMLDEFAGSEVVELRSACREYEAICRDQDDR